MPQEVCTLRRCQGRQGCICPKATCVVCGVYERVPTAALVAYKCLTCSPKEEIAQEVRSQPVTKKHSQPLVAEHQPVTSVAAAPAKESDVKLVLDKFRLFDLNGDGVIDPQEMRTVLQRLDPKVWTDARINLLMKNLDTNQDGLIQYEEFVSWADAPGTNPLQQAFHYAAGAVHWASKKAS